MNDYDLLVVCRSAPYGNANANEALDLALAAGSFDQNVAMLFVEDGVYQLLSDQAPEGLRQKNLQKMLSAASFYGISLIAAESASLFQRKLHPEKHLNAQLDTQCLSEKGVAELYHKSKTVIRF